MIMQIRTMTVIGMAFIGSLLAFNSQASVVSTILSTPWVINNDFATIDVDNDGYEDLFIGHSAGIGFDGQVDAFVFMDSTYGIASEVAGGAYEDTFALAFTSGNLINGDLNFDSCGCGSFAAFNYFDTVPESPTYNARSGNYGYWANGGAGPGTWPGTGLGHQGYIGFAFDFDDGSLHYGWAQIGIKAYDQNDPSSYEVSIYGYGYETLPDTGIQAGDVPEPATWLLLGVGSIAYLRSKRRLV